MTIFNQLRELCQSRRIVLAVLTQADFASLKSEALGYVATATTAANGFDRFMGAVVTQPEGGVSYVVEDTFNGPLIHFLP